MILRKSELVRRVMLFFAMIMSGGSLLFPRLPILAAIVLLYLYQRGARLTLKRPLVPILVLLSLVFLLTLMRPEGFELESTVTRFANFLVGLMMLDLYLREPRDTLAGDLFAVVRWMVPQAIFTVLLAEAVNGLFLPLVINETTYHTFLGLFTYHTMLEDSTALTRPDGFFYEPGVFQIYLNLFLFVALYIRRSFLWSGLGLLAVMLTQSTTGVVIALMLVGWFVLTQYINRGRLPMRVVKFGLGLLLLIPVAALVAGNVMSKVTGEGQGSFWARQYDLITGINVVVENPVIGIGFEYDTYKRAASRLGYAETELADRTIQDRGNTNGIVFLLYSIGVPLALPFLVGMFRQKLFPHRWLIFTTLFLSFLSESMIFTPFFLMIIFSGLMLGRAREPAPLVPPRVHAA